MATQMAGVFTRKNAAFVRTSEQLERSVCSDNVSRVACRTLAAERRAAEFLEPGPPRPTHQRTAEVTRTARADIMRTHALITCVLDIPTPTAGSRVSRGKRARYAHTLPRAADNCTRFDPYGFLSKFPLNCQLPRPRSLIN